MLPVSREEIANRFKAYADELFATNDDAVSIWKQVKDAGVQWEDSPILQKYVHESYLLWVNCSRFGGYHIEEFDENEPADLARYEEVSALLRDYDEAIGRKRETFKSMAAQAREEFNRNRMNAPNH